MLAERKAAKAREEAEATGSKKGSKGSPLAVPSVGRTQGKSGKIVDQMLECMLSGDFGQTPQVNAVVG